MLEPGKIIPGWTSFKLIYYDKSFIEGLKSQTPFVNTREMRGLPTTSFRQIEDYKNHIHTVTENILTWEPWAFTITLAVLVVTIGIWAIQFIK